MITVKKNKIFILVCVFYFFLNSNKTMSSDLFWEIIKTAIKNKEYQKSYDLLSAVNLRNAVINHQILYDLSAYKVKKNKSLLCLKSLKNFPQSKAQVYTMSFCDILHQKQLGKKIESEKYEAFEMLLKQYPKENYLLEVVKEL